MSFGDKSRYWIIFDVCLRPEYYRDVHNLLALPKGSTMRYEYREAYLSTSALKAAISPDSAPSQILFVYGQWVNYKKNIEFNRFSIPIEEMIWIPTRIGEMQLIPSQEGENFFFDFKVTGYPKFDTNALENILSPLIEKKEIPFRKFVCISDDNQSLNSLGRGKADDNWQKIVDSLGTPPIQFAGDAFWRIRSPVSTRTYRNLPIVYQEEKQRKELELEARRVTSLYSIFEGSSCSIEVVSHSPRLNHKDNSFGENQYRIEISLDVSSPLSLSSRNSIDLRQYTSDFIKVAGKRSKELDERIGILELTTKPQTDEWSTGPSIVLGFRVTKAKWRVFGTIITGLSSLVSIVVGAQLIRTDLTTGIYVIAIGVLLTLISGLLFSGKLEFKI